MTQVIARAQAAHAYQHPPPQPWAPRVPQVGTMARALPRWLLAVVPEEPALVTPDQPETATTAAGRP